MSMSLLNTYYSFEVYFENLYKSNKSLNMQVLLIGVGSISETKFGNFENL